jgi:hypothetical protein
MADGYKCLGGFLLMVMITLYRTRGTCKNHKRAMLLRGMETRLRAKRLGRNSTQRYDRYLMRKTRSRRHRKRHANDKRSTRWGHILAATLFVVIAFAVYAQWDPHQAERIGEAGKPGPLADHMSRQASEIANAGLFTITTRNVHGLMANLMGTVRSGTQVICVQEADLSEPNVADITNQALTAGYIIHWGKGGPISKDGHTRWGRRTCIMVQSDIKAKDISIDADDNTQYLHSTGRWVERLLPVKDGSEQVIVACLYGVSGASGKQSEYEENERLVAAAIARKAQFGDVPYIIATDLNVNPDKSETLQKAIDAQITYDIVKDAHGGSPPMTFCRQGVHEGMQGSGVTRIDAFLINTAACHVFNKVRYDYRSGKTFDHVPINLTLSLEKFEDYIKVASRPAELNVTSLTGMKMGERKRTIEHRQSRFTEVWARHAARFRTMIDTQDLEGAHNIWCLAAETFLWELQNPTMPLPPSKPRRGTVMPTYWQKVTGKTCDTTSIARNSLVDV